MIRESRDQGSRPFDGLGIVPAGLYQPLYGFELCRLGRWGLGGGFLDGVFAMAVFREVELG
jgi:hypothetical protein